MAVRMASIVLAVALLFVTNGNAAAQGQGGNSPSTPLQGTGTPGTVPVWVGNKTLGDSHIRDNGSSLTLTAPISGGVNVSGSVNVSGTVNATDSSGGIAVLAGNGGVGVRGQGTIGVEGLGSTGVQGDGTNVGVYGNGTTYGVYGTGTAGVFASGTQTGVAGNGGALGVAGHSDFGTGVRGSSTTGDAVRAESARGRGVYATTSTAGNNAIVGEILSTSPSGATGVIGICPAVQGTCNGVVGITSGRGQGVIGVLEASSQGGDGIHGYAYPTSGAANGIVGETFSPDAAGVIGLNNSAGGQGVRGGTDSAGGIGVLGYNNGGGTAIQAQGNVRIFGNMFITGSISNTSSRRFKSNIESVSGALGKVQRLRGVTFNWNETGKHDIGLVAEEVAEVVPEVVSYDQRGEEVRGVDYARLTALLIEAIKEQQAEIKQLRSMVESLNPRD